MISDGSTAPLRLPQGSGVMWLDDARRPAPRPALTGHVDADLVIVGAGYLGLWSALHAVKREPGLRVIVVDSARVGDAASGRNGGFVSSSLTHGLSNGLSHWPDEVEQLERLGLENLDALQRELDEEGIDCDFERVGKLNVAIRPHEVEQLKGAAAVAAKYGRPQTFLDQAAVRARLDSPTYLAGTFDPVGNAIVNPARLVWGLAEACERRGVVIYEGSPATAVGDSGATATVTTAAGSVSAARVVLATNGFPSLLKRLSLYTVPVYDYALGTAPLSTAQLDSIGWGGREGVTDVGNEFHYYRLTRDNRILWGGYDAVYHFGSRIGDHLNERPETFQVLARQFFETFPQLEGLPLDYGWGGVIDTCTRFTAFYGTALGGKVGYAMGFTGLGVGSTRFAADVVLDLLAGASTERMRLKMVRSKPLPWPPEPLRALGITWTKASLAASDHNGGKRNLWLRALDAVGVGFDS